MGTSDSEREEQTIDDKIFEPLRRSTSFLELRYGDQDVQKQPYAAHDHSYGNGSGTGIAGVSSMPCPVTDPIDLKGVRAS